MQIASTSSYPDHPPSRRGNLDDMTYAGFRARVQLMFADSLRIYGALFRTDADVWSAYLDGFPAGQIRQHHNCSACRRFLREFGDLAVVDERGAVDSALWDVGAADDVHLQAVRNMRHAVRQANITGVFLHDRELLGVPVTGAWAHLALRLPAEHVHRHLVLTAHQASAAKREAHGNVLRALNEYTLDQLQQVVDLLKTDALYRSEKVLGPAEWLLELAQSIRRGNRTNLVWRAVATAPEGFCHPRSSMIGTILDDLAAGVPFARAAEKFAAKMHPLRYQRPTAAPAAGNVAAAEVIVKKLGIERSLERRYARVDEIQAIWRPAKVTATSEGVFGHLVSKDVSAATPVSVDHGSVTWSKFQRFLADAVSIDIMVPIAGNFCGLLTAEHDDAPPILQWDVEPRNPFSWYVYHGGSAARFWDLRPGWRRVTAVTTKPSMWHGRQFPQHGQSVMFVVEGCRDTRNPGLCLFPEILRSELHEVRATIEAHSRSRSPSGADQASACGLMFHDRATPVSVRVRLRGGSMVVCQIDRWE